MASFVTIPSLLVLFQVDRELHEFQVALDLILKDQVALEAKIEKFSALLAEQEAAARQIQTTISSHELELKSRQEHIEKMRETLNATKTNKEYSAILLHISAEKAEASKIETLILEQMEELENCTKAIAATRDQIVVDQGILASAQRDSSTRTQEIRDHMDVLRTQREKCIGRVPTEALKQYERLRLKYPGDPMAPVEFDEDDLDNISCGGCFMNLNTEDVNKLRGRDEIRRCNSCNRILYLPEMLSTREPARQS